jgi:hypothetical protein
MALHHVSIYTCTEADAALQVDAVIYLPAPDGGFADGFVNGDHSVCIALDAHYGQADPIVCNTLVNLELGRQARLYREYKVGLFVFDVLYHTYIFNDARKHKVRLSCLLIGV